MIEWVKVLGTDVLYRLAPFLLAGYLASDFTHLMVGIIAIEALVIILATPMYLIAFSSLCCHICYWAIKAGLALLNYLLDPSYLKIFVCAWIAYYGRARIRMLITRLR